MLTKAKMSGLKLLRKIGGRTVNSLPYIFASLLILFLGYLVFTSPVFPRRECPNIYGEPHTPHLNEDGVITTDDVIDCEAILADDTNEILRAKTYSECAPRDAISDGSYLEMTKNCDDFLNQREYQRDAKTEEERNFPIAYSILMFEHVEQTERLLRAIYQPQNIYCIHVDAKAHPNVRAAMQAIAGCFENVFIASRMIDVTWAWFPVLEAEVVCMRDLWKYRMWRYFINLTGREFPLRTNSELVQILKAYDGGNDVDGTLWRRPIIWTKYHWRSENWRSYRLKSLPPHGFNIAKGSTHIAVSRDFVDFALHNGTAQDLLEWMRDIRSPDEHYFSTLNHNPQKGVPGAYTGNPDLKWFLSRFKVWQSPDEVCDGRWFRFICNFDVGDLWRLSGAPQLFANKFRLEFSPVAFSCFEQWYKNRTKQWAKSNFNITFYRNQPWVKNHFKKDS